MPGPLRELDEDLWVVDQDLRFFGAEVGTRMTVVRLADGGLFLHSPVKLSSELRRALDALGPVRFAVAPNKFHHLYVGDVARAWPQAELWAAPGLERKRRDVAWKGVLSDAPPPGWAGDLAQQPFRGFSLLNEVAFHHPKSRTLLLTDLAFHFRHVESAPTRLVLRLLGGYGRFGPTRLEKIAMRDRAAARASLERILAWDFDRVTVTHGEVLESGGQQALREGYRWLLSG